VPHISIRPYTLDDAEERLKLQLANKKHFQKWSPVVRSNEFFTKEGQQNIIKESMHNRNEDKRYDYAIILSDHTSSTLIGEVQFNFVQRGPKQSSMLGYQIGEEFNGKGYMTEALKLALDIGFNELKFHRITAQVNPANPASIRVLEKVGFVREGYARKSLKVGGEWCDHVCFALLEEEYYSN
jgi:ribosomal-protein-alanine N-acetyltransferase